jgi:hypothetical protein
VQELPCRDSDNSIEHHSKIDVLNTCCRIENNDECKGADQWVRIYLDDLEVAAQPLFQLCPAAAASRLPCSASRAARVALYRSNRYRRWASCAHRAGSAARAMSCVVGAVERESER